MAHYPKPNTKPNPKPGPKANPTPNPKQVSAISSSKLPAWKRPVMNADVARIYNEHAAPIFRKARPARPHARPHARPACPHARPHARPARPHARPHARPACPRLPGHTSGRAEDTRRRCPPRKPAESQPHPHRASPPPPTQLGIEVVDTYSSGLRHPELSADGVHFPGAPRAHAAYVRTRRTPSCQARGVHTAHAIHLPCTASLQARSRGSTRRSSCAPCATHQ